MERDIVALDKLLGKIDRAEKGLELRIEKLDTSQHALTICKEEFFTEIEELRSIRHALEDNLTQKVGNAVQESIRSEFPQIVSRIVAEFNEKTQEGAEACLQKASGIVDSVETTIKKVAQFHEGQKISMTWRRLGLNAAFCVSAILTAVVINCFWETRITYEMTPEIARSFFVGEAVNELYNDLTEEQKTKFVKLLNKRHIVGLERKQGPGQEP